MGKKTMKKMMMIAAAALVAGLVQASQITWAASGILDPDTGLSIGTGGSGFAFTGSTTDRAAILAILGGSSWAADFATYQSGLVNSQTAAALSIGANSHVALGGDAITTAAGAATSAGATGGYDGAAAANSFVGSTQQSVFFVVFDSADWTTASHYSVSVLNTQALPGTGIRNYATSWANWGGTGVAGTWTEVVPEPTSMALLALGVAVVGLRRRFRK